MYCAHCGTPLTQGLSYCNRCGANLKEQTEVSTGAISAFLTAITLIGIPLLTLVLASVRPLLAAERALSNSLLGTEIPRAGIAPGGTGWIGRLKA